MRRTFWLIGQPGVGKTSVGRLVVDWLERQGYPAVLLDGDELRATVSADLGFSPEHRREQTRRVGELCRGHIADGRTPVVALCAPFADARLAAYARIPGKVVEVLLRADQAVLVQRRPRLYAECDVFVTEPSELSQLFDTSCSQAADVLHSVIRAQAEPPAR